MTIKKMTQTRRRMFFKMFSITIFLIFIIILYYELLGGCICRVHNMIPTAFVIWARMPIWGDPICYRMFIGIIIGNIDSFCVIPCLLIRLSSN
jgi:hypothetical protein